MMAVNPPSKFSSKQCLAVIGIIIFILIAKVRSNGHMYDPPGRSIAWKYGFNTEKNDNHNKVGCGRVSRKECGVCGDFLDQSIGEHTIGGKYGTGTIVKTYKVGQVIQAKVRVMQNYGGYFEFSICKIRRDRLRSEKEKCFRPLINLQVNRRPKQFDNPKTKWELRGKDGAKALVIDLQLPARFRCRHCTLRWIYNCGNDYGCSQGKCGRGFGPRQEKYYSCADIAITKAGPSLKKRGKKGGLIRSKFQISESLSNVEKDTEMICKGEAHGQRLLDPENCCGYLRCVHPDSLERGTCATGTAWNNDRKECDHFSHVKCGTRDDACLSMSESDQKPQRRLKIRNCAGKKDQENVPDPENCCGYIICMWPNTVHEKEQKMQCPPPTSWDQSRGICNNNNTDCSCVFTKKREEVDIQEVVVKEEVDDEVDAEAMEIIDDDDEDYDNQNRNEEERDNKDDDDDVSHKNGGVKEEMGNEVDAEDVSMNNVEFDNGNQSADEDVNHKIRRIKEEMGNKGDAEAIMMDNDEDVHKKADEDVNYKIGRIKEEMGNRGGAEAILMKNDGDTNQNADNDFNKKTTQIFSEEFFYE